MYLGNIKKNPQSQKGVMKERLRQVKKDNRGSYVKETSIQASDYPKAN